MVCEWYHFFAAGFTGALITIILEKLYANPR